MQVSERARDRGLQTAQACHPLRPTCLRKISKAQHRDLQAQRQMFSPSNHHQTSTRAQGAKSTLELFARLQTDRFIHSKHVGRRTLGISFIIGRVLYPTSSSAQVRLVRNPTATVAITNPLALTVYQSQNSARLKCTHSTTHHFVYPYLGHGYVTTGLA